MAPAATAGTTASLAADLLLLITEFPLVVRLAKYVAVRKS